MTHKYVLLAGAMCDTPPEAHEMVTRLVRSIAMQGYRLVTGCGLGIEHLIVQTALVERIPIIIIGMTPEPRIPLPTRGGWVYVPVSAPDGECAKHTAQYISYRAGCDAGVFIRYWKTERYSVEQRMIDLGKPTSVYFLSNPKPEC
jgi:hypothetical protein